MFKYEVNICTGSPGGGKRGDFGISHQVTLLLATHAHAISGESESVRDIYI